jgi:hypothetical protein
MQQTRSACTCPAHTTNSSRQTVSCVVSTEPAHLLPPSLARPTLPTKLAAALVSVQLHHCTAGCATAWLYIS